MSSLAYFWSELKRRKVIRVAVAYVIIAWVMVEVSSVMFPGLNLPEWTVTLVIALAIIGFPVALVLAWAVDVTPEGIRADPGSSAAQPEDAPASKAGRDERSSVAVLPFVNLSNDPDNEYFSDGISEELLNLLCKVPKLTVASRTSSFSFKGKDADLRTIAQCLDVDVVLEGSVRRSGERVRITAQLIDAPTDRHLWSETYDRELSDVFDVQDEIAHSIVDALKISLSPDQRDLIRPMSTTSNMEAYDYYLRGRHFLERAESDNARIMFEKAITLDESFAAAYAGIAEAYAWKYLWAESNPRYVESANDYSARALALSPGSAEAHAARCLTLAMSERFDEAVAEANRAIEIDPRLHAAYYYKGRAYFAAGDFPSAAEAFRKAGEIRPDDHAAASLLCTAVNAFGNDEEKHEAARHAVEVCDRYLQVNPDDATALARNANSYISLGEFDKGLKMAERAYRINPKVCG